jgi:hypothetical protein
MTVDASGTVSKSRLKIPHSPQEPLVSNSLRGFDCFFADFLSGQTKSTLDYPIAGRHRLRTEP